LDCLMNQFTEALLLFGIVVGVFYLIIQKLSSSGNSTKETMNNNNKEEGQQPQEKKFVEIKDYTPSQLAKFNGVDGAPIYICVKGNIYDVSSKPNFYGPAGPYGLFAGKDASRALAKGSLKAEDVDNTDISDLKLPEVDALNQWEVSYQSKYDLVGKLVPEKANL
jgi:membrane-associated progesterone receptor component